MQDLILLHGAIDSADQLRPLEQALQPYYRIHNVELPGHGSSHAEGDFSIPLFAGHVKDYCEKNLLKEISIFGYSMGGYIALYLALKSPSLFSRVITLATKFHWDEMTAEKEVSMLQPLVIEQKIPLFAKTLAERHGENWKTVVNKTAEMLAKLGKYNELQTADLSAISSPVLVMLGDRDRMVTMEETIAAYKSLPASQLAVLPATPHPMEQTNPALIAFFIRNFIG